MLTHAAASEGQTDQQPKILHPVLATHSSCMYAAAEEAQERAIPVPVCVHNDGFSCRLMNYVKKGVPDGDSIAQSFAGGI